MKEKSKINGGKRPGAGRKPKIEELQLIERLSPFEDVALKALEQGVRSGEFPFIKLYMEYRYGKPKESVKLDLEDNFVHVTRRIIGGKD